MPQSLVQIYLHLGFSTKHRQPFLKDKDVRDSTHSYLAGICKNLGCPALLIGGVEDHVHTLCRFSKTIQLADLIRAGRPLVSPPGVRFHASLSCRLATQQVQCLAPNQRQGFAKFHERFQLRAFCPIQLSLGVAVYLED